jgi:hypothetical protein
MGKSNLKTRIHVSEAQAFSLRARIDTHDFVMEAGTRRFTEWPI